eukprot:gene8720-biopygen10678
MVKIQVSRENHPQRGSETQRKHGALLNILDTNSRFATGAGRHRHSQRGAGRPGKCNTYGERPRADGVDPNSRLRRGHEILKLINSRSKFHQITAKGMSFVLRTGGDQVVDDDSGGAGGAAHDAALHARAHSLRADGAPRPRRGPPTAAAAPRPRRGAGSSRAFSAPRALFGGGSAAASAARLPAAAHRRDSDDDDRRGGGAARA